MTFMEASPVLRKRVPLFFVVLLAVLVIPGVAAADADVGIRDVAEGNVPGLSATINGSGITYFGDSIRVTFQNDTTEPLVVHVPIGTQLIPANVNTQTMITAGGENITVPPGTSEVIIKAFCGEKNDGAPSTGDTFSVGDRATGDLLTTAENINREGAFDYDGQTAIWHVTDGAAIGEGSVAEGLVGSGLSDGEKAATAIITAGSAVAAAAAASGGGTATDDDLLPDEDLFPDAEWEDFDENDFEDFDEPEIDPDWFPEEEQTTRPDPDEVSEHAGAAINSLQQLLEHAETAEKNRPGITQLIKIDAQLAGTIKSIEDLTDPRDFGPEDANTIAGTLAGLISIGYPPATIVSIASALIALGVDNSQEADNLDYQTRSLLADLYRMRGNIKQSMDDLSNTRPTPQIPTLDPGGLSDQELEPTIRNLHNQAMNHLNNSHDLEQRIASAQSQLENNQTTAGEMRRNMADLKASESGDVGRATAYISLFTGIAGGAGKIPEAMNLVGGSKILATAASVFNETVSTTGTTGGFVDWCVSLSGPEQQELYRACLNQAEYQNGLLTKQLQTLQQQHASAQQALEVTSKLRTAVSNEFNSRFGRMPPRHLFGAGS